MIKLIKIKKNKCIVRKFAAFRKGCISVKYKILLIGRNKVLIGDFFQHLEEDFEMQTSSMRFNDISSHIHYFEPDAVIFCMNKEEKERTDIVASLRETMVKHKVFLVLTGDQKECEEFQKVNGEMGDLILKKPIMVRSIKEKVVEALDARRAEQGEVSQETAIPTVPQPVNTVTEDAPAKKHVLVIDDDPMMLKLIKEQLKDNYAVATAVSGAVAFKFLENKKTNLIILDYEMPGENGVQVLEKIRSNPKTARLPVVFLTGVKDREKIRKLVGLKPQGYLLKPIDSEKLINSIKSIIG